LPRRAYIHAQGGKLRALPEGALSLIGGLSPWHLILIVVLLALVFGGRGKISALMGDTAKGIRAFKDGLKGEEEPPKPSPAIPHQDAEKEEARR
jgi:sec-independent protein translocase protein TatA